MSETVVITGANRGIGLELARQWHQAGAEVIAVCRTASDALRELGVRLVEGVDVSTDEGVAKLRESLQGTGVDILFNNAGIMLNETLSEMDFDGIRRQMEVNALGPLRVTLALLDLLDEGSKVAMMTSRMGSIADNTSGGKYGYRMSKAALNAASKSLAVDLASQGIAVAILHPGFVQTDMTGNQGQLEPAEAASRLIQRVNELTLDNSGTFWHSDGSVLPW